MAKKKSSKKDEPKKKPDLSGGAAAMTDEELDALAVITEADILGADRAWQEHASKKYKDLLRAEDGEEPIEDA